MPRGREEFERHISERKIKPPNVLYKYQSMDVAWQILASRQVLFSSPLLYNDPFDTDWDWFWPIRTNEFRHFESTVFREALIEPQSWPHDIPEKSRLLLESMRQDSLELPASQRESAIESLVDDYVTEADICSDAINARMQLTERLRLFCLTETRLHVPMWSHYADNHRGMAIGFRTEVLEQNWDVPAEKVDYHDAMPCVIDKEAWAQKKVFDIGNPLATGARRVALVKHKGWESEKEWRFVSVEPKGTLGQKCLYKLPSESISSLVLGCRADRSRTNELAQLAAGISSGFEIVELGKQASNFDLQEKQIRRIASE